ncbi:C2H2-type domain-containing protein [Fusarium falciforme]|uniref:C2H2-type domain-containing protein n=1 Tax=Fusarium falciforme TaxID=195108 RepID=UPI0023016169|nr:C2H2-type domain-containing protein [Fusarium falciforme]WAO97128.1 C2H2-type domain-containing protein [Fusarium falciforme]
MADADDTPDEIPTPPVQAMKDSVGPSLKSTKQIVDETPKYCIKGNLKDYSARSKNDASKQDVAFRTSQEKKGYECTVCRKTFYRKSILKKHLKRHARPYGCTFLKCKIDFGSKHDWKRHESGQHCQAKKDCNRDGRFWCGFCTKMIEISDISKLGTAWAKRCDHIDDHFCGRGQSLKHISEWKHEDPSGTKASSRPHETESDSLLRSGKLVQKSRHGPKANAKLERSNNAQSKPENIKSYGGVDYTRRGNEYLSGMLMSQGNTITINGEDFVEYRVIAKIDFA